MDKDENKVVPLRLIPTGSKEASNGIDREKFLLELTEIVDSIIEGDIPTPTGYMLILTHEEDGEGVMSSRTNGMSPMEIVYVMESIKSKMF